MPYSESRKARERRLRAKYRKKTAITSIITLILGLIVGFVLCVFSVNHTGPMSRMLKIGPLDKVAAPEALEADATVSPEDGEEDSVLAFNQADGEPADLSDLSLKGLTDDAADEDAFGAEDAEDAGPFDGEEGAFDGEEPAPEGEEPADEDGEASMISALGTEGGAVAAVPEATEEATEEPTAEPTEEPTPEPTEEPTPEPTAAPVIVPYGQPYTLQTQIKADGSERAEVTDEPFETLSLTIKVDAYKDPAYFQEQYANQFKLQGDEAAVQFDITLNGYTGTTEIIPQNFLLFTFAGEDPEVTTQGYQLMDAEIAGKTEVAITSDVTSTLYKRYSHTAEQGDMAYMVVTACNDGVESVYWFEILPPEPVETPAPEGEEGAEASESGEASTASSGEGLTVGSQGDAVSQLQRALINKGLLQGSPDGKFGNYTADAVRSLQKTYGMEQTGIADQAFLERLYADQ